MVELVEYFNSFLSPTVTDVVVGFGIILVMVVFLRLFTRNL